jgi:hypothetical protein
MGKQLAIVLSLLTVVASLVAVAPANAKQGRPDKHSAVVALALQGRIVSFAGSEGDIVGTWQALGAFADAGTYTEHFVLSADGGSVVATKTLTSAAGGSTIRLEATANVIWLSPTTARFSGGSWHFLGGTGRYAGIQGGGSPGALGGADLAAGTVIAVHVGTVQRAHESDDD